MKKFYLLLVTLLLLPVLYVQAQEVDILWQGETYVPPFYQGRSLWSNQSKINFVAIAQGLGDPAKLSYRWTKNGTVLGKNNGIGRNTLSFFDTVLSRPQILKVDIIKPNISPGGYDEYTILASAHITVTPIIPTLLVYENNPLYGFMFHRETSGTFKLKEKEITFSAFPFFFSALNRMDDAINYEWHTNIGEAKTANSVTYRVPDNVAGSSQVSVRASNRDEIMQYTSKNFLLEFGK